jgi:hypothetical protein
MRNAIHADGETWWRAGVVEAEQGDHTVDVDQQEGNFIWHLAGAR